LSERNVRLTVDRQSVVTGLTNLPLPNGAGEQDIMNNKIRKSIASVTLLGTVLLGGASVAHAQTATTTAPTATTAANKPARGQGGGFAYHAAEIAKVLGMTTADLSTAMQTKSLATIAGEKGVSVQAVIDAYVAGEKVEHPDMAAADIVTRVTNMVNNVRTARPADGTRPARGTKSTTGTAATPTTVKA
jgi:hypothetical protein